MKAMEPLANTRARTKITHSPEGTENIWHEFWRLRERSGQSIRARVSLTQPEGEQRQFIVETGSGHHFLIDDAHGHTGATPVELVAAAVAGCMAFDVIMTLRAKHQPVTAYDVHVEAEQAERPPQVFVVVRIHHVFTGRGLDAAVILEAIRNSEQRSGSVQAMLKHTASIETTFEIHNEPAEMAPWRAK